MLTIRSYEPDDEVGWVRCRVLSFLGSAFGDAVERAVDPDHEHRGIASALLDEAEKRP